MLKNDSLLQINYVRNVQSFSREIVKLLACLTEGLLRPFFPENSLYVFCLFGLVLKLYRRHSALA